MEFIEIVSNFLSKETGKDKESIKELLEKPKDPTLGDLAFPCFVIAKDQGKDPVESAKELKDKFNRSDYNVFYFHPRDFDYLQPKLKGLSLGRWFKSYYGLKNSMKKFKLLLKDFDFLSVREAVNIIDWDKTETIDLIK